MVGDENSSAVTPRHASPFHPPSESVEDGLGFRVSGSGCRVYDVGVSSAERWPPPPTQPSGSATKERKDGLGTLGFRLQVQSEGNNGSWHENWRLARFQNLDHKRAGLGKYSSLVEMSEYHESLQPC